MSIVKRQLVSHAHNKLLSENQMSNSSESENVDYSDSEVYEPNTKLTSGNGANKETKELQPTVSGLINANVKATDVTHAPSTARATLSETKNAETGRKAINEENNIKQKGTQSLKNTRALPKESFTYELEKFEKNAMIIFNHEKGAKGFRKRLGTEKDVEALKRTFSKFGFEVEERKDRTKAELLSEVEAFANSDFTDYGCVAVVVLTHGLSQGLLLASDDKYSELELINPFLHKPLLVTKPVIFIIQACRGEKSMEAVAVHQGGHVREEIDEEVEVYTLPVEADMLILHSSYIGKPAIRNTLEGSWFVQSLCNNIDGMAASHDLEAILTEVKREVALKSLEQFDEETLRISINKQMPVITSTLIRKLFLKKFGEEVSYRIEKTVRHLSCSTTCSCFLPHFDYIKSCLRFYIEENPNDATVRGFLDIADTFKDNAEFNSSKEKLLRKIREHLETNAQEYKFFKYLHVYKY